MNIYDAFHYLASTWLEQQDLDGKSPVEISDLYFKALQEIQDDYKEKHTSKGKAEVTVRAF